MRSFCFYHDYWLGKLFPKPGDKPWHPFVEKVHGWGGEMECLAKLGWVIFDVLGDGNCGYYVLFWVSRIMGV